MQQQSIARALRQIRESQGIPRDQVVAKLSQVGRIRSLSTVRKWEETGSIKLDDALILVESVFAMKWADFEAEIARQEELAKPKPRRPRRGPKASGGGAAAMPNTTAALIPA